MKPSDLDPNLDKFFNRLNNYPEYSTPDTEYIPSTRDDIAACELYFAYGMNTNVANMDKRTGMGPEQDLGAAILPGYQLEFKIYCDVVPADTDTWGVLWRLTPEALEFLDVREGYPDVYTRSIIEVYSREQSKLVSAWVYHMTPQRGASLAPPPASYWTQVNQGYAEHGIPSEQLDLALARSQLADLDRQQQAREQMRKYRSLDSYIQSQIDQAMSREERDGTLADMYNLTVADIIEESGHSLDDFYKMDQATQQRSLRSWGLSGEINFEYRERVRELRQSIAQDVLNRPEIVAALGKQSL
jgi:cation transport regulator ChaC